MRLFTRFVKLSPAIALALAAFWSHAQCPTASFSGASVCAPGPMVLQNQTSGATTQEWDFCAGDLVPGNTTEISDAATGALTNTLWTATAAKDNIWRVFGIHRSNGSVYRSDYGNGLQAAPSASVQPFSLSSLGSTVTGITIFKAGNNYHGFAASGVTSTLGRLDFGTSLGNVPVITSITLPANTLSAPRNMQMVQENGNYILVVANNTGSTLTLINFGSNPTGPQQGIIQLSGFPNTGGFWGISVIRDCENWYGVVTSSTDRVAYTLDFGTTLFDNTFSFSAIAFSFGSPYQVQLVRENNQFKAFVCQDVTPTARLAYLNYGSTMAGSTPTVSQSANILAKSRTVCLVTENSLWYNLYYDYNGSAVVRMSFADNCNCSPQRTFSGSQPPAITYTAGTNNRVALLVRDAADRTSGMAQTVAVSNKPDAAFRFSGICEGSPVQFNDSSSYFGGTPNTYSWSFGDGNNSTTAAPANTYVNPGNFTVTLMVQNTDGCRDTASGSVSIQAAPIAGFSSTISCAGANTVFTNTSSAPGSSLASSLWSFGDGDSSSATNPVHLYTSGGNYNTRLVAINALGCIDTLIQNVVVKATPVAAFSLLNDCFGETSVFVNNSSVTAPVTITGYQWDLGNSTSSVQTQPSLIYGSPGSYPIQLIADASNGCSDTLTQNIRIGFPPTPAFSNTRACSGSLVQFTDQSTFQLPDSISRWAWDFGTGDTSTLQNPVYRFPAAGTYPVRLCVFAGSSCDSCLTKNIRVLSGPSVDIVSDTACAGQTLQFSSSASVASPQQIAGLTWDFNQGQGSGTGASASFSFSGGGVYPITLTLTTDSGCVVSDTAFALVYQNPNAQFTATGTCSGNTVDFTDLSTAGTGDTLLSWSWNFGDGNQSVLRNPSNTYATSAIYTASLQVTTVKGCSAGFSAPAGSLNAQFTFTDSACRGRAVNFTNTSASLNAEEWDFCAGELLFGSGSRVDSIGVGLGINWDIDPVTDGQNWYLFTLNRLTNSILRLDLGSSIDGTPAAPVSFGNPGNRISSGSGIKAVRNPADNQWYLLVSSTNNSTIQIFTTGATLTGTPVFVQSVSGPAGTLDGPRFMSVVNDRGNLILAVANNTGGNVALLNFRGDLRNSIGVNDTLLLTQFNGSPSIWSVDLIKDCDSWYALVSSSGGTLYLFNLGSNLMDRQLSVSTLSVTVQNAYHVKLVNENAQFKAFIASESNSGVQLLNFGSSMSNIPTVTNQQLPLTCRSLGIARSGSSWRLFHVSNSRAVLYKTTFPDPCLSIPAITNQQNTTQTAYQTAGNFRVSMKAVSANGSVKYTARTTTSVSGPLSAFSIDEPCFGSTTLFRDSSTITSGFIASWNWDFGDNTGSTQRNTQHAYADTGNYQVRLITTGNSGCSDTLTRPVFITEKPTAAFTFQTGCQRDSTSFTDASTFTFDPINFWSWSLTNRYSSTLQNPVFFPDTFGSFSATLRVRNSGGCYDSVTRSVTVLPKPQMQIRASRTCVGDSVHFINTSFLPGGTITGSFWDLGDTQTASLFSPVHQYADTGVYQVIYYATVSNGCNDSLVIPVTVSTPPAAAFDFGKACSGSTTAFNDLSVSGSRNISQWAWNFGDGQTDSLPQPQHTFALPGNYTVQLRVTAETDCSDSISATVDVLPSPVAAFAFSNTCFGDSNVFVNQSTVAAPYTIAAVNWDFGNGDTSSLTNPVYQYPQPGYYNVVLTAASDSGCRASVLQPLRVSPYPVANFYQGLSCALTATVFTDQSFIPATDTITQWTWNFGNGNIRNDRNPVYNFPAQGLFPVTLTVSTNNGCADTLTDTVEVFAALQASIRFNGVCAGDSTFFEDATTSFSLVNRFWNFGDFSPPSGEANPVHLYATPGTYAVTLSVENAIGCQDTVTIPLTILSPPDAGFSFDPACLNRPVTFVSNTTAPEPISRILWESDGAFYQGSPLALTYSDTGSYSIKLMVTTASGCKDTAIQQVQVTSPPNSLFGFSPLYGEAPLNVLFSNQSTGAVSYEWNFGEPNALSNDVAPAYTYTQNSDYTIQLVAFNAAGCSDTSMQTIRVIPTDLDLLIDELTYTLSVNGTQREVSYAVRLANVGTRVIIDAQLQAETGNNGSIRETWQGILYPGQVTYYTFRSVFVESVNQPLSFLCVDATEVNMGETEINTSNNGVCRSLNNRLQVVGPYPNPSEGKEVWMSFILPKEEPVEVSLHNATGQTIVAATEFILRAGKSELLLPAAGLRSGIYFIKLKYRDETLLRKLMVR